MESDKLMNEKIKQRIKNLIQRDNFLNERNNLLI